LIAPGVVLLVAAFLMLLQKPLPALIAAAVAGVMLLILALRTILAAGGAHRLPSGAKLGSGPHSAAICRPTATHSERFARTVRELSDAATQQSWIVDWNEVHKLVHRAETAAHADRHADAIRDYCRTISFLMRQVRNQRPRGNTNASEQSSEL
jgi:hypothetical protein